MLVGAQKTLRICCTPALERLHPMQTLDGSNKPPPARVKRLALSFSAKEYAYIPITTSRIPAPAAAAAGQLLATAHCSRVLSVCQHQSARRIHLVLPLTRLKKNIACLLQSISIIQPQNTNQNAQMITSHTKKHISWFGSRTLIIFSMYIPWFGSRTLTSPCIWTLTSPCISPPRLGRCNPTHYQHGVALLQRGIPKTNPSKLAEYASTTAEVTPFS